MNDKLTEKIIGAAFRVHNVLGFGFYEKVYENAMMIELRKRGIKAEQQFPIKVWFEGEIVGDYKADILVENEVVLELKSVVNLKEKDEVQLVNNLQGTKKDIGLLINFGQSVEVKRKYRTYKPKR